MATWIFRGYVVLVVVPEDRRTHQSLCSSLNGVNADGGNMSERALM